MDERLENSTKLWKISECSLHTLPTWLWSSIPQWCSQLLWFWENTIWNNLVKKVSVLCFQLKCVESIASNIFMQIQVSSDDSMYNYGENRERYTTNRNNTQSRDVARGVGGCLTLPHILHLSAFHRHFRKFHRRSSHGKKGKKEG